jgi:molybdopterin-guanine dinucleotide biosynthesis protein A
MKFPKTGEMTAIPGGPASDTLQEPELEPTGTEVTGLALWAVIFAGGIGSRFWPLSTPERPKPLLALVTGNSLLEDTIGRLQPLILPERVAVISSRHRARHFAAAIFWKHPDQFRSRQRRGMLSALARPQRILMCGFDVRCRVP